MDDAKPTWSKLKPAEKFLRTWQEHGYRESDLKTEYPFIKSRRYRLDFAWPSCKVGVEIHGFGFGHQAQQGLASDCEKMRMAIEHGWLIVPFTTRCISSKANCYEAVAYVCELLSRRHGLIEFNEYDNQTRFHINDEEIDDQRRNQSP